MKLLLPLLLALSAGCVPAVEAPEELSDLVLYLFSNYEEDEATLRPGAENMASLLHSDFTYDGDWATRQVMQPALERADLGGAAANEAFDVDRQKRVGLVSSSRHPVSKHIEGTLTEDWDPLEPSATQHDRTFVTETDCWIGGACDGLDTINQITKSNILYTVPYEATKNYRRVVLDDGRPVLLARVDQPEIGFSADQSTTLDMNFALELWVDHEDQPGISLRVMFVWTAVTINGDPLDGVNLDSIISPGIQDTFDAHDAWYDEN